MNGREEGLIGGLISHKGEKIESILTLISKHDFDNKLHRSVFTAIKKLHDNNDPIDLISITEMIESDNIRLDKGDRQYLMELSSNGHTFGFNSQMHFASLIREYSDKKKLAESADKIAQLARTNSALSYDDLVGELDTSLSVLRKNTVGNAASRSFESKQLINNALNKIKNIIEDGNVVTSGLSYGVDTVDDFTNGMHAGDLIVVAGRPGMGKTTFSMGAVIENCIFKRKPTLVFSLEMPADQLFERLISNLSGVPFIKFRKGGFSNEDIIAIDRAIGQYDLANAPLYIYDEGGIKLNKLRNIALDYYKRFGVSLIMVDYLQLMNGDSNSTNRTEVIGEISRGLKQLAKDLKVPVIMLSQLNRSVEQRVNKRPVNSDLRESGSVEQDADAILFLYRDEYYNPETNEKGITEIILGKSRHSETGIVKVGFEGKLNRFTSLNNKKTERVVEKPQALIENKSFIDDTMISDEDDPFDMNENIYLDYNSDEDNINLMDL